MSHIHIPDGVLPLWLWVLGYVIVFVSMFLLSRSLNSRTLKKKIPLVAAFSALIILSMSFIVIPPVYHLKLVAFSGIILGPWASVVAAFVVNLMLALAGHGGITIVGLNTVVLALEAIVAFVCFRFFKKHFKKVFLSACLATIIALVVSVFINARIIYAGTSEFPNFQCHQCEHSHNHNHKSHSDDNNFNLKKFLILVFSLGSVGIITESLLTGFIVSYISRIKPDLINYEY